MKFDISKLYKVWPNEEGGQMYYHVEIAVCPGYVVGWDDILDSAAVEELILDLRCAADALEVLL